MSDRCEHFELQLSAHIDGELTPEETAELEAHLSKCPACRVELRALHATVDAVRSLPVTPAPAGLAGRIAQEAGHARPRARFFRVRTLWPAAAAAVIALVIAVFIPSKQPADSPLRKAVADRDEAGRGPRLIAMRQAPEVTRHEPAREADLSEDKERATGDIAARPSVNARQSKKAESGGMLAMHDTLPRPARDLARGRKTVSPPERGRPATVTGRVDGPAPPVSHQFALGKKARAAGPEREQGARISEPTAQVRTEDRYKDALVKVEKDHAAPRARGARSESLARLRASRAPGEAGAGGWRPLRAPKGGKAVAVREAPAGATLALDRAKPLRRRARVTRTLRARASTAPVRRREEFKLRAKDVKAMAARVKALIRKYDGKLLAGGDALARRTGGCRLVALVPAANYADLVRELGDRKVAEAAVAKRRPPGPAALKEAAEPALDAKAPLEAKKRVAGKRAEGPPQIRMIVTIRPAVEKVEPKKK